MNYLNKDIKQKYDIFEKHAIIISIFLIILTCSVYLQTKNNDFVSVDDNFYVTENEHIISGITLENIKWAFSLSGEEKNYWHPLTLISHMLDIQLWGLDAGKHHLTNLFLHIINTLLLFLVLRVMTGSQWKSAFVAALFALHPINVDTVAWIAERKNLLSTCFWFIVMLTYFNYTKRPSLIRYLLVVISFIMGLLAKPMLITLPFVLLLLDYWPLDRLSFSHIGSGSSIQSHKSVISSLGDLPKSRVILDKIPLILLSFLSVYVSTLSLKLSIYVNIISYEQIPIGLRIGNALVSYIAYIGKAIWPHNLAVYYPFPQSIPFWQSFGAFLLIVFISAIVIVTSRRHPYLLVGWLWYAGTLIPVSGLYQSGIWPAMADRWAYVPFIGIFIMVAWGVPELLEKWRLQKYYLFTLAGASLSILMIYSWIQVGYWKNSDTLFEHCIKVTVNNDVAHLWLAKTLIGEGDLDGAAKHCNEALKVAPNDKYINLIMGEIFIMKGDISKAVSYYTKAILIDPTYEDAYNSLGVAYMHQKRFDGAIKMFSKVLEIKSENASANVNMGICLESQGRVNEAIHYFNNALQIKPNLSEAHYNLGNALLSQGKIDKAVEQYRKVLITDPNYWDAQQKLIKLLANKKSSDVLKKGPDFINNLHQ